MEEYQDLHLTIRLFKEILADPKFKDLEAGIVLQAYLPDTFECLVDLAEFAQERVAQGGAPIKIRFVKGANLSMEHVQGEEIGRASCRERGGRRVRAGAVGGEASREE